MKNTKSSHILNTSSNLLGICFIVLTSIKVLNLRQATLIDDFTAIAAFTFMTSSLLSFLSIRSVSGISTRYERIAELCFIIGLLVLFLIIMVITFDIVH